jgi:hypothetical protein
VREAKSRYLAKAGEAMKLMKFRVVAVADYKEINSRPIDSILEECWPMRMATAEARRLLEELAVGAAGAWLTEESERRTKNAW